MENIIHRFNDSADYAYIRLTGFGPDKWIMGIYVPKGHRGEGVGTLMLNKLLARADKENETLHLFVDSDGDMSDFELTQWYSRHGFENNRFGQGVMSRIPNQRVENCVLA